MRILRIEPIQQPTTITKRTESQENVNFKGLWGDDIIEKIDNTYSDNSQMFDGGTLHINRTRVYHPFADETTDEIKLATKGVEKYIESDPIDENEVIARNPNSWVDLVKRSEKVMLYVKEKLPFTKAEFAAYQNRDLLSKAEMALEDSLKLAKLKKYLRR